MKATTQRRTLPKGNWQILTEFEGDQKNRHISTISRPQDKGVHLNILDGLVALGMGDNSYIDWKFETVIFGVTDENGHTVRVPHETEEEAVAFHERKKAELLETIKSELH